MTGVPKQDKNLNQNTRRQTAPEKPEKAPERAIGRAPERALPERALERLLPQRASTENNFQIDVIQALQPPQQQIRGQGLHQQPRRIGAGMTKKIETKNRRRVSTMLAAIKSQARGGQEVPATTPSVVGSTRPWQGNDRTVPSDKTKSATGSQAKSFNEVVPAEKESLYVPPKRMPLHAPSRGVHQPGADVARRGNSGGKENIPPGKFPVAGGFNKNAGRTSSGNEKEAKQKPQINTSIGNMGPPERHTFKEPQRYAQESLKRGSESMILDDDDFSFISGSTPSTAGSGDSSNVRSDKLRLLKRRKLGMQLLPTPPSLTREEEAELAPFSLPVDHLQHGAPFRILGGKQPKQRLNPVLQEDLFRTEMYEESWLMAQESSVSQLLNSILSDSTTPPHDLDVRKDFVRIYSAAPFPLLFKRLQASLLYGALSVPKDILEKSSAARFGGAGVGYKGQGWGWAEDIAIRKRFMALFFDCYNLPALIPGLEVVIGREMFPDSYKNTTEKRKLAGVFFERYLVKCEDVLASPPVEAKLRGDAAASSHGETEDWGGPAWLLRRSLLRSLLLVLLMDKGKSQGALGSLRLFKKSSPHKSSASILQSFSRLLLPSVGDILRPLSHLNYLPEVSQHPLEEYEYEISNLAVDMRDGVRLCRVVELLLYPQPPPDSEKASKSTNQLPLSSNLKLPATTQTHKLYNVSLALTALESVGGNPRKVTAKEIIDGFREKTVGLLWGVVSRWGLELLVDWKEVKKETRRLQHRAKFFSSDDDEEMEELTNYTQLLYEWAGSIAKLHGLCIDNLTTSFSDGKVFAKIVEEYEQFFPVNIKRGKGASLEEKLKALGCSSYFSGLFANSENNERIFDEDFVIAGLAYLCSRLFQWSVKERAAVTIQRAYRSHAFRCVSRKRITLLILAHECAIVANTRIRVTNAAITIQRAYRGYLHLQIKRLVSGTIKVQSIMRGALARIVFKKWVTTIIMTQRTWREIRESRFWDRIGIAKESMIGLQAVARGVLLRKRLEQQNIAVKALEEWWSNRLIQRGIQTEYLALRSATIMIQKWWRVQIAVQIPRQDFRRIRNAIVNVQTISRGLLARHISKQKIQAACVIQQHFKAYRAGLVDRLNFLELRWATLNVQRLRRSFITTRQERAQFLALKAWAVVLQRNFRRDIERRDATILIQKSWRKFAWLVRLRKIFREVVTIQSVWRGYKVREASNARVRIARRRLQKAISVQVADSDRLCEREKRGLDLIKTPTGYGRGAMQLDIVTRYSRECAIRVVKNEVAMLALLSNIETFLRQPQKHAASAVARNLALAVSIIHNISQSSYAVVILAKPPQRPAKKPIPGNVVVPRDVFTIILDLIDTMKLAAANTPQSEILNTSISILKQAVASNSVRQRLLARKKWVEKLGSVTRGIKDDEEKRSSTRFGGGKVELAKASVLEGIMITLCS